MYTLRYWRSHLGSVEVYLLHQEPAGTVGETFTAYFPEEVTQVSAMTNVHPKFLEKSNFCIGNPLKPWETHLQPKIQRKVTQVFRMTNVNLQFL